MRENRIQIRVNFGDTDKAGIVYYPNYFKWFDIAGHQFFRSIGLPPAELEARHNIIIPLLDARCTFEKTLLYDDIITLVTKVSEINNKTFKLTHQVFRGETRTGHGYELRGWVKQEAGMIAAVRIPEQVRLLLEPNISTDESQNGPWLNA